jgi:hypothetical protein
MKREKKNELERLSIRCKVLNYNFSPKGGVEGLIVDLEGVTSQITCPPHIGTDLAKAVSEGATMQFIVEPEPPSPKGKPVHPVYRLVEIPGDTLEESVSGIVSRLNYAKHGEPNGVVLDTGDFVHLKPDGMRQTKLKIGDRVKAKGEIRSMELGHHVVEATHVNNIRIKQKPKPH